ncbi:MAG: pirin family protein [Gammaproteobacteria bacterium]
MSWDGRPEGAGGGQGGAAAAPGARAGGASSAPVPMTVRRAVEMKEGAGVDVQRLMPVPGWLNFDPFVFWDHFAINPETGFPEHSHRGFEAVTYLFTGAMRHEDNLGNRSTVVAGGAQRFTAGAGIAHSELPVGRGTIRGIQLWINLPQRLKAIAPDYQQVDADMFPVRRFTGGHEVEIVGKASPLRLHTPVEYLAVHLEPGAVYRGQVPADYRGFVYVVDGAAAVNGRGLDAGEACFMEHPGGIQVEAWQESLLMFCFGRPHGEPIRQNGPYVD